MGNIKDVQLDSDIQVESDEPINTEDAKQKSQINENQELLKKIDIKGMFQKIKGNESNSTKPKTAVKKPIVIHKVEADISPETQNLLSQAENVLKPKKYQVNKSSLVPKSIQKNIIKINK